MFFETYNAYVHIDIKTVTKKNIGDITNNIFVGNNQNSYKGSLSTDSYTIPYKGNLHTFYTKSDGCKKICLTYFIAILYNEENLDIQTIILTCMPNGELSEIYEPDTLNAGKNIGKVRYNYSKCKYFRLLDNQPLRTKVLLWTPESESIANKISSIKEIYEEQENIRKND